MKKSSNIRWVVGIIIISIFVSMAFTLASTEILSRAGYIIAFAILAVFIFFGILFDVIGVAVTVSLEAPFHSMASHKERGAAEALRLIRNADKVSSFCNDVVGDVSGIVSGSTAALLAARLIRAFDAENLAIPLLISGAVTGLTIGGKAVGKSYALRNCTAIVLRVGKLMNVLSRSDNRK